MNFLNSILQDIRIGFRVLVKEKSFCALAVTVLAIGICAVTTQYSVVNGVVRRGFSFPNAERIVDVRFIDPSPALATFNGPPNQIFALDYEELKAGQQSYERIAAYIFGSTVNLTYNGVPQRYTGAYVTEDFLKILGVTPVIGRDITAADNHPGAEKVALISHQVWQRDFGGRADIVNTAIRLNGKPATIIGVMPKNFAFPINEQLWIPLFSEFPPRARNDRRGAANTPLVVGLLKPGVSIDQASAEATTYAQRLSEQYADTNKQYTVGVAQPLIRNFTPPILRLLMYVMLGVCVLVLLLACANVMNMQFGRATLRAKELAVRSSLGATRARLIRQMLTESLLVATMGAVIGVALAYWATDYLMAMGRNLENPIPAYISFEIDAGVMVAVVAATTLSAVVSGVLPAWVASRANAVEVLQEGGRGNTSRAVAFITRALVVLQIVLTFTILVFSGVFLKSIVRQQTVDYGYDTQALMIARMGLMDGDYPTAEARQIFYDRLVRELRASPEVASATLTNRFRMTFVPNPPARIEIDGRAYQEDRDRPNVVVENIYDGYFDTLGVKILEGRDFTSDDSDTKMPVAIVNATFARKQFGNESALGRRFRTVTNNGQLFGPWRTIVGVVADTRMNGPFPAVNVEDYGFYIPYYAAPTGAVSSQPVAPQFATVVVRPRGQIAGFANNLRRIVARVDSNLPLYFVDTAAANQASFLGANRIIGRMFTAFGIVAMILASVGLYGVMSFAVNQRTQEFGIRMALGADNPSILRMVMRQGAFQVVLGLVLGLGVSLVLSLIFSRGLRSFLFQVSAIDPMVYVGVAILLSLVAGIACVVPARRATRVDPMIALRAE